MLLVADGVGQPAVELDHLRQVRARSGAKSLAARASCQACWATVFSSAMSLISSVGTRRRMLVRLAGLSDGPDAVGVRPFRGDLGLGGIQQAAGRVADEALLGQARDGGELLPARRRAAGRHLRARIPGQQVDHTAQVVDLGDVAWNSS